MAWGMEMKSGFGWSVAVVIVFLVAIAGMAGVYGSALRTPAMLILPLLAYIGFLAWVRRVK